VRLGIDSISLNPDSIVKTTMHVLEVEQQLEKTRQQWKSSSEARRGAGI
jgi:hypothetical protein